MSWSVYWCDVRTRFLIIEFANFIDILLLKTFHLALLLKLFFLFLRNSNWALLNCAKHTLQRPVLNWLKMTIYLICRSRRCLEKVKWLAFNWIPWARSLDLRHCTCCRERTITRQLIRLIKYGQHTVGLRPCLDKRRVQPLLLNIIHRRLSLIRRDALLVEDAGPMLRKLCRVCSRFHSLRKTPCESPLSSQIVPLSFSLWCCRVLHPLLHLYNYFQ